ncbi:transmembrane protein, putative (macronuclear) [Tetrahymena thermophila SB210]|uniref:Transmembrane protein, putative n=1 Tax=Tetrahymena thermophila (strain SB210) TaxID=312017 RepID=Q23RW4_TETTS|nr:transmembrane protein, putative [Tetrahymena thermophila SB210]EAR99275.2 transmembrane protein, putative [Tetrahymena thermophila SB210]|eukprot:XP_001019520.2 transmembrane protein, putative [Tetrahymena thermophila SB210]
MGQILSFLFSVYNYILFLPSLECTTIILSSDPNSSIRIICYFNYLFTWGIGLLQSTHDYDYSFEVSDYLSQDFARTDVFNEIIAGIYCSISQITLQKYSLIFCFLFSVFKICTYFKRKKYYQSLFSLMYIQFSCFQLLLSIVALFSIVNSVNSFAFLGLVFAPISAKIGQYIKKFVEYKNYQRNICREDHSDLSPHQFDSFIRLICYHSSFFYEDYIQNQQGVFFENLYDQQNGEPLERYIKNVIGQEFRKEFTLHYILNLYSNYLNKVEAFKKKYIVLSYISFLVERIKNVTKSFQELLRIQQEYSKHKDYANLFCIQILMERSQKLYKQYTYNQDIHSQTIKMHDPITFDFLMVEFQTSLKTQIQKQIEYFKYLCSDYFNLEELMIVSKNNLNGIQNIKVIQKELYDIHPNDQALNSLSSVFQLTLDFYCVSPKILKQKSAQKQNKSQLISQIDVFSPDSCSVYCSLVNKNIEINRTSSNFSSIFEIDQISVLGKHVSNLLPKMLYQLHELTMDDFINMESIAQVLSTGLKHAFALNGNGFVFPVSINVKIENFKEDFGVTSLITRINDSKQYIFFNELFQISEISSLIYEKIFSSEYTLNQLKNQNIFNFIPLLQALLNDNTLLDENYYNTCLLLRKKYEVNCENKVSKDNRKQSVYQNQEIYSLIFKVKNLQSKHMKHIKYLEIVKFQEEKSFQGKKYQLNLLSKCLNIEFQFYEETQGEPQEQNYEFQIASLVQDDNDQKQILLNKEEDQQVVEQVQISNQKIDSKVDVEIISQFNIYEQQSNTNICANKYNEDEITYSKRKISSDNYLHNNSTTISKNTPQDQYNHLIYPKYDITSYQQLMNATNKLLSPLSSSNLINTTNYPQENQKVKNTQRSTQQLFQKQIMFTQSMIPHFGGNNIENASLKYAICDFNQLIVDKWFDSPSSIVLYNQNNDNKDIENNNNNNSRAQDNCSIKNQKHIQNQFQNENSSDNSTIKGGESRENQIVDDQQQSAFTGSQNTQISTKKIMIKKITKNTDTGITKAIVFTGLLSIIALYSSVLSFYVVNTNNMNLISDLFSKYNTANIINEGTFWFTREQQFALDSLIFAKVLGIDKPIVDPKDPSKVTSIVYEIFVQSEIQQRKAVQEFSQNINSILHSYNENFFNYISQTQISTYSDYVDQKIYTHVYRNHSILYTMMLYQSSLNQLYLKGYYQELYPQSVIYGNIQAFSDAILKIQDMIQTQLFESYQQLKDNQVEQLIQTLVSAFLLIIIAVPFMIYFKQQQYQTIKLLGSFPPALLQQYIGLFNYYLNRIELYQRKEIEQIQQYQSYNALQSMRSISVKQISGVFDLQKSRQDNGDNQATKKIIKRINKKRLQTQRQRQIASFSKAKPFRFKYIFISLLIVCPFMIYPIFNLITANLFVEEALDTLAQRNIILSSSQFILNFEVVHYKIWEIAYNNLLFKNIFFYNYGLNITKQSSQILQGIKNLTNYETSSRYGSDDRQQFFNSLLLDSSCTYIDKMRNNTIENPYFQTNFTGDNCRRLLSGSFDRGFVLAFQHLTNIYQDWFSLYQEYAALQTPKQPLFQNITQSIANIQRQENNILDIYQSNLLLQQISTSFEKFFEIQNEKYTKYILKMFTILMVFQLILIFLAISIVWTSLYKKFKKEINKTRLLLTNLHIDMILENKLIQQYLKRK